MQGLPRHLLLPRSLRHHLVALVLVTALPLVLLGGLLLYHLNQQRREIAENDLLHSTHAMRLSIDGAIRTNLAILEAVAQSPLVDSRNWSALAQELDGLNRNNPDWSSIALAALDGTVLVQAGQPPGPAASDSAQNATIHITTPVSRNQQSRYQLDIAIPTHNLVTWLALHPPAEDQTAYLVDKDGHLLARLPDHGSDGNTAFPAPVIASLQSGQTAMVSAVDALGVPEIYSLEPIHSTNWTVVVAIPQNRMEQPAADLYRSAALLTLALMTCSAIAAHLFGRRMSRAMARLGAAAQAVMRGETLGKPPRLSLIEMRDLWESLAAAAAQVNESRARYKDLVDHFPGALFRLRMTPNGERRMIFGSDGYQLLTGYSPEELVSGGNAAIRRMVHPDDYDRIVESRLACWSAGRVSDLQWRLITRAGRLRWVQEFTKPVGREGDDYIVDGYLLDVTAEIEAKAALRDRNDELDRVLAALELAGEGILVLDAEDCILYINRALAEAAGLGDPKSRLGETWSKIVESRDLPAASRFLPPEGGSPRDDGTWQIDVQWERPQDGQRVNFLTHCRLLPDGGRIIVATDVTELHAQEMAQRSLEQKLEHARRLEAVGQLAGGIAHDFNNILGSIIGFAQFIIDDASPEASQSRYGRRILTAGQRAKALVAKILTFSRNNKPTRSSFELGQLVQETRDLLAATIPSTTSFALRNVESGVVIDADHDQIAQVLLNLCINANDALEGLPGDVEIAIGPPQLAQPYAHVQAMAGTPDLASAAEFWSLPDGRVEAAFGQVDPRRPHIALSVTDNGCGMSDAVVRHIIDPFFTTKEVGHGTGLGLAVVHGIVMSHGGALLVRSGPGQGTRFEVVLPLAAEDSAVTAPATHAVTPPSPRGRAQILLVDDDVDFADMLMTALDRQGYEVAVCNDPVDALAILRETPVFDLLITDQTMPKLRGTDLVRSIRPDLPTLPCLLCTGNLTPRDSAAALEAGIRAVVSKPLDLTKFMRLVEDTLIATATKPAPSED